MSPSGRTRSMFPLRRSSRTLTIAAAGPRTGPGDRTAQRPCQPRGEQVGRGRVVAARDRRRQHRLVGGLVQSRREQAAPQRDPGPGQIGVAGGIGQCPLLDVRAGVLAVRRVGDAPLGHRADGVLRHVAWCVLGPPRDDGGVGQQQRDDDAAPVARQRPVEPEDDDLAGARVAAHTDLGVEPGDPALVPGRNRDDPARVLVARVVGHLDGPLGVLLVHDDDQRQDPAEGHGADVLAKAHQLLADRTGGRAGQVDDHGILQTRPSRRIISSALSGPQPPAG